MAVIVLKMTDAGLAAVQAASGTDPVAITELGLTAAAFDYAPTLTALPGEFKRLDVASGTATAPNVTHLTAYDTSGDTWTATGLGLFLDDGTLFAVHASDDPIMTKVALAFGLLAFDISFEADLAASIAYGNAVFTYPAATEETPGVTELATQAEVDAAADDQRIVTPLKLATRLAAVLAPFTAAIGALTDSLAALLADVWRPSNDGHGSGLDADLLDGQHGAWYAPADTLAALLADVWRPSNDGAGSGLDADLLDGRHGAWYAPTGMVATFAVSAAPAGWLVCDGAAVSREIYAGLFDAIGTNWGPGDGALTFNVPDLRGEFVRGWDDTRGIDLGRVFGSAQADSLKAHEHTIAANTGSGSNLDPGDYLAVEGTAGGDTQYILHGTAVLPTKGSTGSTGDTETRPRNVALLYCIKT